jgi:hypothetical protein
VVFKAQKTEMERTRNRPIHLTGHHRFRQTFANPGCLGVTNATQYKVCKTLLEHPGQVA